MESLGRGRNRGLRRLNYYQLLGVARNAAFGDIMRAYWSKAYSADGGTRSLLNEAYEVLGSDKKRAAYDAQLHNGHTTPSKV